MVGTRNHTAAENRSNVPHLCLGRMGEEAALAFMAHKGFSVLARNWRPAGRAAGLELDLVGTSKGSLIFVEVKSRRASAAAVRGAAWEERTFEMEQGDALAAFTPAKRRKVVQAARYFLREKGLWSESCRFDLVCVTFFPDDTCRVEHHTDVIEFNPSVGSGDTAWQPW